MSFDVVEIILNIEILPFYGSVYEHIRCPLYTFDFLSSLRWKIMVFAVAYLILSFLAAYEKLSSVAYILDFKTLLEYEFGELGLGFLGYFDVCSFVLLKDSRKMLQTRSKLGFLIQIFYLLALFVKECILI